MNETTTEMPRYKCHKEVHACMIKDIVENPNGSIDLFFYNFGPDKTFSPVNISAPESSRFANHEDDLGYFIVYEDGYVSWSPTKAFEEGYSLI